PRSHRSHRLARVRLRRRWISSSGYERVCVVLGGNAAAALVHGRAVRAGGARAPAVRFRTPFRPAGSARDALHVARVSPPALDRGDAFAVVGIPPGTERDVLKGTTVHVPTFADATYLFIFRSMANGIAVAINTLSTELAAGGARTDGSLVKAALASTSPAEILLQPIFNPVGGYASYIVPAAFVLILQQILLIGASMLTVVALAQRADGAFATVLGRGVAHLTIYLPALALYFIVLPRFYGFSALGHPLQLFALASVFV